MIREIRQFRTEDAENVAQMWNESDSAWPGGFTGGVPFTAERVLRDQTQTRFISTFVAFADGKAVGYCSLTRSRQDPRTAYVATLSAHPSYHGQGFGRDLLKAALARTVELGFDRLDLHTWAGNLKAVPLYKKTGFFWVPGTAVHMENYLPTILRQPLVRDFLRDADWYACFQRDLSVRPDDYREQGARVYPYEFRRDGERLRVLVDPESRGITAVETEAFSIACRARSSRAPIGVSVPIRWDLDNRRPERGPLRVAVVAEGERGLGVALRRVLDVESSATLMGAVLAATDAGARRPDDPAHVVRTTVVVGSTAVDLTTGVRVCKPVEVSAPNGCLYLTPGLPRRVALAVHSNLESTVTAALRLAGPAGAVVEPAELAVDLPPNGHATVETTITASVEGAHVLSVQVGLDDVGPDESGARSLQQVPIHVVGLGGVVSSFDDHRVFLTTAQLRVIAHRRAAAVVVTEATSGAELVRNTSALGPPFGLSDLDNLDFDVHVERTPRSAIAVLSGRPAAYPCLTLERRVEVAPGPAVRIGHRLVNASDRAHDLAVQTVCRGGPDPSRVAAPLAEGLMVEEAIGLPDWQDPRWTTPASFRESWLAYEGQGLVVGWAWDRASAVEAGGWSRLKLQLPFGEVPPGGTVDGPPLWLYGGPGGWDAVRHFWRAMVQPGADSWPEEPGRALGVVVEPAVLAGGAARLELRSLRGAPQRGHARLDFPVGPAVEPAGFDVGALGRGAPHRQDVRIEWPRGAAAGAWQGTLRFASDAWLFDLPVTLIRGGDGVTPVRVGEEEREGRRVVVVDNGRLTFAVAPDFAGSLVSLSEGAASHVLSAFPAERPYRYLNPWFGGVTPQALPVSAGGAQPMAARSYRWSETEREGLLGQTWRGVALTAAPEHEDLVGLGLTAEYLTLGGSNLVAVAVRTTGGYGPIELAYGALVFPAPGGSSADAIVHFQRGELWSQRPNGTAHAVVDGWVAVENPRTGDVVALVAGSSDTTLRVVHQGRDLTMLAATIERSIDRTGPDREAIAFLVVGKSLAEARLYQSLVRGATGGGRS